jgi:predicted GNAT family N-acyltransferase
MQIAVREVKYGSFEYDQEVALRDKILRKPLGLQFSKADLDQDVKGIHLAAFNENKMIACLILTPISEVQIKMRQVAVESSLQGSGVGRQLVAASEVKSKELGFLEIVLNAREAAVPFYLKLGYEVHGEPFAEVNIPHRKMRKKLS